MPCSEALPLCSKPHYAAQAAFERKTHVHAAEPRTLQERRMAVSTFARLIDPQNLIPLGLRPFRLCLSSEHLRSARIVLLKATHLPFVGAIWLYEQLADAGKRDSMLMSFSGPQTPTPSKRPPRLPVNSPRLLMGDGPGRGQFLQRPQTRAGFADSDAQLKSLVLKLSTQVEELTAMVSQLSEQRGQASPSAA